MRTRRLLITLALLLSMSFATTSSCNAFWGVGDVVFDPSAYANAIKSLYNEAVELNYQFQQLEQIIANAQAIDGKIDNFTKGNLLDNFRNTLSIARNANNVVGSFAKAEKRFDLAFPGYAEFAGKSGADHAADAKTSLEAVNESIKTALQLGAVADSVAGNGEIVGGLLGSDNSALAAAQVGNRLSGMLVSSIDRTSYIMTGASMQQSAYIKNETLKDAKKIEEQKKADERAEVVLEAMK